MQNRIALTLSCLVLLMSLMEKTGKVILQRNLERMKIFCLPDRVASPFTLLLAEESRIDSEPFLVGTNDGQVDERDQTGKKEKNTASRPSFLLFPYSILPTFFLPCSLLPPLSSLTVSATTRFTDQRETLREGEPSVRVEVPSPLKSSSNFRQRFSIS